MKYNFDEIIDRRKTDCIKWDFMENMDPRAKDSALPMWIADTEFKVAQEIIDDLHKRVEHGIFGYSLPQEEYYEAVINWYQKRFNWTIKRESIFHSAGIVPAIGYLVNALSNEGDGIIIQPPVYYPFAKTIRGNKRVIVENVLVNNDGYYTIDFANLFELASKPENKMLIFCTPHNPVGRVWTKEELEQVIKICKETNTYLISDEIHCDLTRKNVKNYPLMTLCDDTSNVISLVAPSKTFNMPGLQMSVVVIENEELQVKYNEVIAERFSANLPNAMGIVGATSAYKNGEVWLEQVLDYIEDNLNYLADYVKEKLPKAKFWIPEGTYLAWLNLADYGDTNKLMDILVLEEDLLIENGNIFGESGQGYFRINVACPKVQLQECLEKIEKGLKKL